MDPPGKRLLVGVVGPCGAGKSTLIKGLERHGYVCRHIAQEHSYVQAMWQVISKPDVLIYLHSNFQTSTRRRARDWREKDYKEQLRRLAHAREHAHIVIPTDDLSPTAVLETALAFLRKLHT